ncbi:ABC transporter substrate-binding protein [Candidatus Poribacteria bacterium]|nr:MAG: ABC transporter substrate-binding protein [Candidatus Poribacteria bacterium]
MKRLSICFILLTLIVFMGCGNQPKSLTIVWAEWDPANYLQELSKDFTAETGIAVDVVQISWDNFQDKVFTSFVGQEDIYDIVIGDSQWLGRNSVGGHYIDLTDWIKENIDVESIYGPAMTAFAEYPKGSGEYWALPAEVDAAGYVYRKDLFEDPKEMVAFQEKYGYALAPPKTYAELRDIAEFFTRPDAELYGIATWYSKISDGITMGFQQVMWSFGASYGDPKTYKVDGYINNDDAVKALEFYKDLLKFAPPDAPNYYWKETSNAYLTGKVAMAMNFFAFFPGVVDPAKNPISHDKSGFFVAPAGPKGHYISIGGQGMSISTYSKNQDIAKEYLKWFMQKSVQEKWAKLGGFTPLKEVLESDTFKTATPYNEAFAASFPYLRDFWAVPQYAELLEVCQTNWSEAITDIKSSKEALDTIAQKHEEIFAEAMKENTEE